MRLVALKNFVGRALLVLLAFTVLELGARGYILVRGRELRDHYGGGKIFERYPPSYVRLRPDVTRSDPPREITTQGLAGDLFTGSASELNVVALGGSTSFYRDYVGALRARFQQDRTDLASRVRFATAGTPGYTVYQTLVNFQTRVLALRPDLAIVYHGINDLLPLTMRGVDPEDFASFARALTSVTGTHYNNRDAWWDRSAFYTLTYNQLLALALDARRRPYSVAEARATRHFERDMRSLIGTARAHGVDVVLVTFAHNRIRDRSTPWGTDAAAAAGIEHHNEITRGLAAEFGTLLVDAARALTGEPSNFEDFCHFSPKGRDHFVQLLLPTIEQAIERRLERRTQPGS